MKVRMQSCLAAQALLPLSTKGLFLPLRLSPSSSSCCSFTRRAALPMKRTRSGGDGGGCVTSNSFFGGRRGNMLMYEESGSSSDTSKSSIVWSALASTEKWIQQTLSTTGGSPAAVTGRKQSVFNNNPYARKEVSYVCETSERVEDIVAGIYRRLREMREIGVGHGEAEKELSIAQGPSYRPHTFRQTLIVVIPSSEELSSSFELFDNLINAINNGRRNARDYVTDISLEQIENEYSWKDEWVTSVNLSHLHPKFGMHDENLFFAKEDDGDQDPVYREYQERKMEARRSPFPSLVIEVRSVPPLVNEAKTAKTEGRTEVSSLNESNNEAVTKADVRKLEALFGKSAVGYKNKVGEDEKKGDDAFYDAICELSGIDQLTFQSPVDLGQQWVLENDKHYVERTSSFMAYDTKHVDAAYEFVFATVAMQLNRKGSLSGVPYTAGAGSGASLSRDYLIMPNFLSKAATSFEKFASQVDNIISLNPNTCKRILSVSTFHPEHVEKDFRSPVPILVLTWTEQ